MVERNMQPENTPRSMEASAEKVLQEYRRFKENIKEMEALAVRVFDDKESDYDVGYWWWQYQLSLCRRTFLESGLSDLPSEYASFHALSGSTIVPQWTHFVDIEGPNSVDSFIERKRVELESYTPEELEEMRRGFSEDGGGHYWLEEFLDKKYSRSKDS